ncbi:MAG: cobyric acid synthase, partial [Oscillospiraceae bacterium]
MAKAIMVVGTTSNAGKSLLAAGLCRVFSQDGYSVAPFKSQNMALNSFITSEGLEMGRAQVFQAEAAGIAPSVRMNPILLKPTGEAGSQVIVNGEVLGNMTASEYYAYKHNLLPAVMTAYESLAAEYDIIVLEGAGSPAEINLKQGDFVNMGMARLAHAPALLIGDIDRGGVFASLYGTLALLDEDERTQVKGMVINKFRGDEEILRPGLRMLEELTHTPVLGVLPYLHLDLDDEDSLTDRFSRRQDAGILDIAVLRLPRISNFTDFNALEYISGVTVRYVGSVGELGQPDLLILPGTKNTMDDLLWLRQNGLEAATLRHAASGRPVIGICGGYQMLGERLDDPDGIEHGGTLRGMGLLPAKTIFEPQKIRTRAAGRFEAVGGIFSGLSGA